MDVKKCFAELDEILKYVPESYSQKIPLEILNIIKSNKDINYKWTYDTNKSLSEQNVIPETFNILTYLNLNYMYNTKEKEELKTILYINESIEEQRKRNKYNLNDIFEKKKSKINIENTQNMSISKHKETFIKRIIKLLTNLI